jgi:hypothetical protein
MTEGHYVYGVIETAWPGVIFPKDDSTSLTWGESVHDTERRCRVVNTHSYLGGPGFKSQPGHWLT